MAAFLGAIGSALTGGLFSAFGAARQNREARAAAREQMAFQERMYRNRYQYQMADMAAAGLNPILAYQQGAPAGPGGSSYTPANIGAAGVQGATAGVNSAVAAYQRSDQHKLIGAQIDKLKADTAVSSAKAAAIGPAGTIGGGINDWLKRIGPDAAAAAAIAIFGLHPAGRILSRLFGSSAAGKLLRRHGGRAGRRIKLAPGVRSHTRVPKKKVRDRPNVQGLKWRGNFAKPQYHHRFSGKPRPKTFKGKWRWQSPDLR